MKPQPLVRRQAALTRFGVVTILSLTQKIYGREMLSEWTSVYRRILTEKGPRNMVLRGPSSTSWVWIPSLRFDLYARSVPDIL